MTIPTHQFDEPLKETFGSSATWEIQPFSSGAVSITVRTPDHVAVMDGTPEGEWGFSVDPDEAEAFTGHHDVAENFLAALGTIRALVQR